MYFDTEYSKIMGEIDKHLTTLTKISEWQDHEMSQNAVDHRPVIVSQFVQDARALKVDILKLDYSKPNRTFDPKLTSIRSEVERSRSDNHRALDKLETDLLRMAERENETLAQFQITRLQEQVTEFNKARTTLGVSGNLAYNSTTRQFTPTIVTMMSNINTRRNQVMTGAWRNLENKLLLLESWEGEELTDEQIEGRHNQLTAFNETSQSLGISSTLTHNDETRAFTPAINVILDAITARQNVISQWAGNNQIAELRQRGLTELENHAEVLAFTSKVNTNSNLIYKKDYDLGDRVTCVNKDWGVKINVRITEIAEIYQRNAKAEIEITFGESLPALLDVIK